MRTASKLRLCRALVPALLLFGSTARAAVDLPGGKKLDSVDFDTSRASWGRTGCNAGGCHGSFQGKGGFRLSLFGYEPEKDFIAATRDSQARRVNPGNPDQSLLLLKATGQVEHGGGMRFSKDSWQYQILREWITARRLTKGSSGDVKSVAINPPEMAFGKTDEALPILVQATFADGSVHDITSFCDFRSNDDAVAEVSNFGQVKSIKPGSTTSSFLSRQRSPLCVMIPMPQPAGFVSEGSLKSTTSIAKLSLACVSSTWFLPISPAMPNSFAALPSTPSVNCQRRMKCGRSSPTAADKRTKKIEALLVHPPHAAMWATKFSDITGNDTIASASRFKPSPNAQQWHDWLRRTLSGQRALRPTRPRYPQWRPAAKAERPRNGWPTKKVDAGITGRGQLDTSSIANRVRSADLYWRAISRCPPKSGANAPPPRSSACVSNAYPVPMLIQFDRWTQVEYRVCQHLHRRQQQQHPRRKRRRRRTKRNGRKGGYLAKVNANQTNLITKEVYLGFALKAYLHPDNNTFLPAKALGGPEIKLVRGQDPRRALRVDASVRQPVLRPRPGEPHLGRITWASASFIRSINFRSAIRRPTKSF